MLSWRIYMDDALFIYLATPDIWICPVPAADGADPYIRRVQAMGRGLFYMAGGRRDMEPGRFIYRPRKNNR
jgi:hypothetical protein